MSHQSDTWPAFWPDKMYDDANDQGWEQDPFDPGWSGSWNGYFGKGVENADQESYFQMDDHSDIEWFHRSKTIDGSEVDYYFYPDATDSTRRGLGIRVSVRGLQWSHFLAEDCIFWLYEITNIGTVHYDKACFGMVVGTLAGGRYDSEDDLAFFDPDNDITYSWDGTPGPIPNWTWVREGEIQVGYAGYAFLESPGNPYDGIDNDDDSQDGGSPVLDVATLVDMTSPMTYSIGQELITIDYDTYERTIANLPGEFPSLDGSQISTIRQWIAEGALERNVGGDSVSYADDIRPIFNDHCVSCHISPASPYYSDLDLTTYQGLMDTTENDTLVVLPYYPNSSKLVTMIEGTGDPATVPRMPPRGYLNWDFRGEQRTLIADFRIVEDPHDGIDDNFNGLIDERFGEEVGGKRLDHLWLKYKDYFTGAGLDDPLIDEARDDSIDNDGDWDPLTDDVGFDGVPGTGDSGEGDGMPSNGEPNFDRLDVDESDQIGLTAFDYFTPPGAVRMNDDEGIWARMAPGYVDLTSMEPEDGDFIYGSGYFPLPPGKTERFSMALLFGEDLLDITENKLTVQQIYDNNYSFAKPPDKATVTAVPGDGKVTLYWDDLAESSFDPSNEGNEYDFEGYKIYRATDPGFLETFNITDGLGRLIFNTPIAQFDRKNGKSGFFPLSIYGVSYYLGDDSGISHVWTDTTVENGQRYFYAVTAYDNGNEALGFFPAETSKYIFLDEGGNISTDVNTVWAVPRAPASGYQPPSIQEATHITGSSTGLVYVEMVDPREVADDVVYQVVFGDDTLGQSTTFSVLDVSGGDSVGVLVDQDLSETKDDDAILSLFNSHFDSLFGLYPGTYNTFNFFTTVQSEVFEGQRLYLVTPRFPGDPIWEFSGWTYPDSLLDFTFSLINYPSVYLIGQPWSADYEITFYDDFVDTARYYDWYGLLTFPEVPVNFRVKNLSSGEYPIMVFDERNGTANGIAENNEALLIFEVSGEDWIPTYALGFTTNLAQGQVYSPSGGDTLIINMYKSYNSDDVYQYSTSSAQVNANAVDLSRIKVYPNPYLGANTQEPTNPYATGRGERRITFIHLPNKCSIRIYTVRGEMVDIIHHNTTIDDGIENWNLRTQDGLDIAYGVYVYHVDSPYGEHIGKFAVIK
jgi:hypothetical protein